MRTPTIAIIGAGMSGLAAAMELERSGISTYTVFDKATDVGGVWAANTYPGAACDVPSYLYSFSYAQRRDWSRPCSPQPEIQRYMTDCADRFGVTSKLRLGTEVTRAAWDEEHLRWDLDLAGGETVHADVLVPACGQLSIPVTPDLPGRDTFTGAQFHSAEWDHEHDLRGERVAVIGTGASAVQFIPPVAEQAAHVDVFQRTPAWMLPRRNRAYARWAHRAIQRTPGLQEIRRASLWLTMETFIFALRGAKPVKLAFQAWSRAFLLAKVRDRRLRRKLTPDYPFGCKRILFSSTYYEALQRPNVELVTDAVTEITPRGVRTADGREHAADAIVWGTGFAAHAFVAPMQVAGRNGRLLTDAWEGGARAHLGMTVPGFPNMVLMYGPNTNLGVGSVLAMLETQARYLCSLAQRLTRGVGRTALDVRPEVAAAFDATLQAELRESVWTQCDTWYQDDAGRVVNNWPRYMRSYVAVASEIAPGEFVRIAPAPVEDPVPHHVIES
ncbi:MAG: NAD(P)/FAD-dependent oxidoreductase [Solirubrobacteraceae bacterium]|nr:NAD(P)/FAD-dependent oxidoreductase [Solirubrobacteraceae bacterium]